MADYRDLFDLIKIRDLLTQSFNNEELEGIAFFNFGTDISGVDTRSARVKKLIEHCLHRHTMEELLILVREQRPRAYKEKAPFQFSDYISGYLQKWKSGGIEEASLELTDINGNSITSYVQRFLTGASANVLVIRGVPGAGKSTTLLTIMSQYATRTISELEQQALPQWIPVYIDLNGFIPDTQSENQLFLAIMDELLESARAITSANVLKDKYRLLVLLDALDEVEISNEGIGFKQAIRHIDHLAREMKWSKFIVTTRPGDEVSHWLQRRDYAALDISLLANEQIRDYVSQSWGQDDGDSLRSISDFVNTVEKELRLPELIKVPLQLDTLANFWREVYGDERSEVETNDELRFEQSEATNIHELFPGLDIGKLIDRIISTLMRHDQDKNWTRNVRLRRESSLANLAAFLDGNRDLITDSDALTYFAQFQDYQWTKRVGIIQYFERALVGFHHQLTKSYFATIHLSQLALAEEWEKIDQLFAQSQIKFWFDCINLFPDLFFTESRQKVEARMTTFMNKEKANG